MLGIANVASAQNDKDKKNHAATVANRLNKKQLYDIQYKLETGDQIEWVVEHAVSTKVQMAGETDESSSRSETKKRWVVKSVDALGQMTFALELASAKMWQKIGDQEPVVYDSAKDDEVPEEYEGIAEKVGQSLAVFTIRPNGQVVSRRSEVNESNFGAGDITVPLPGKPVAVGHRWNVPTVLNATDETRVNRKLKARIAYELAKVQGHHAFIKFRTEVLTPIKSQKVKSTIMQQMTDGYIVFDMKSGYPTQKHVEWDEKAQGFEGADSLLTYVGRMTEKLASSTNAQASKAIGTGLAPMVAQRPKNVKLRTRDGKPVTKK